MSFTGFLAMLFPLIYSHTGTYSSAWGVDGVCAGAYSGCTGAYSGNRSVFWLSHRLVYGDIYFPIYLVAAAACLVELGWLPLDGC